MIDLDLSIRGQKEFQLALNKLGRSMRNKGTIRKMLRPGVKPIRDSIRNETPKSSEEHYYSKNGKRISTFIPGHLKKSTQDIGRYKRQYSRLPAFYIGPVHTGKAGRGGTFGKTVKELDAYYAHMALGNALAFEKRVIDKGYRNAKSVAEQAITRKAESEIETQGRKSGFTT